MIMETVGNKIANNPLADSGLDWTVELSHELVAPTASTIAHTTNKRATVRTDTGEVLGIVGPDYQIVQNAELMHIGESIARQDSSLKVSSAGQLRNGARVWLGLEADTFRVGTQGDDAVKPYFLMTNGHDGMHSLSATPTSYRPFCENVLNMALREGKAANQCISIRHKGNMAEKIENMVVVMSEFYFRTEEFKRQANYLAGISMTADQVRNYFNNSYNKIVKNVPTYTDIENKEQERAYNKKASTITKYWNVFDQESISLGSTAWVAFNAVTNWLDHGQSYRGAQKSENKFSANFFGASAAKKQKLLEYTLKTV